MRGKLALTIILISIVFCSNTFSQTTPGELARFACNAIVQGRVDDFLRTVEFFDDVRQPYQTISERRDMEKVLKAINAEIGIARKCTAVSSFPQGRYLTFYFQSADDEYWEMTNCEYFRFKATLGSYDTFVVIPVCAYGKPVVRGVQFGFKDPTPDIIKKVSRINSKAPIFLSGSMDY